MSWAGCRPGLRPADAQLGSGSTSPRPRCRCSPGLWLLFCLALPKHFCSADRHTDLALDLAVPDGGLGGGLPDNATLEAIVPVRGFQLQIRLRAPQKEALSSAALPELAGLRVSPLEALKFKAADTFHRAKLQADVEKTIHNLTLGCGRTQHVTDIDTIPSCAAGCGYLAELPEECRFTCVPADQCGLGGTDALARIADPSHGGYCRRCSVPGCTECSKVDSRKCLPGKCESGYTFEYITKTCVSIGGPVLITAKVALWVLLSYLLCWYLDLLLLRPQVNNRGVEDGLAFRERTKLKMKSTEGHGGSEQHPLRTDLQSTANAGVAGPGTILHFNFQLVLIGWSLTMAITWAVIAEYTNPELFALGLRPTPTPAWMCAAIHRGHRLQMSTMHVKAGFLLFAYVLSFLGCAIYSAWQLRRFSDMDDEVSMKDFAALVRGLPERSGADASAEEEFKAYLEEKTGQRLVGVSIGWNFVDKTAEVAKALKTDGVELEAAYPRPRDDDDQPPDASTGGSDGSSEVQQRPLSQPNTYRRTLMKVDDLLLNLMGVVQDDGDSYGEEDIKELLGSLTSSDVAFAVFETEESRDMAVKACREAGGFEGPGGAGGRVKLQVKDAEPDTVEFHYLGIRKTRFALNVAWGLGIVVLAQTLWVVGVYLPFAYYIQVLAYKQGIKPDFSAQLMNIILVTLGNQIVYYVCSYVSSTSGFHFSDHAGAYYTVLYTAACFAMVVVDLVVVGCLVFQSIKGQNWHTVDGILLEDLLSFQELFEAFGMQKALGLQTWNYSFPSLFLIPYVVEPIGVIVLIRHFMVLIVRSHGELSTWQSQQALSIFVPMDTSRYGDLILNVTLSVLCFFFPAGFILKTFLALAFSHIWILVYDHYRVLRCVPTFCLSSNLNERFAQAVLSVPCGLILVAAVVRSNCMNGTGKVGPMCVHDEALLLRILGAFTLHMILYMLVHRFALSYYASCLQHAKGTEDFATAAAKTPSSWFTANPVHCLRSRYLHGQSPPCIFHRAGREHLLRRNPAAACYFEEEHEEEEGEEESEEEATKGEKEREGRDQEKRKRGRRREREGAEESEEQSAARDKKLS